MGNPITIKPLPAKRGNLVAIANQKGGVGKTTIAVHLAAGLAARRKHTIVVDADPQGNLTSWMLDGDTDDGMFQILIAGDHPVKLVRPLSNWGVGLLPGNYRTGEALTMLAAVNRLAEIPARLRPLARVAEYVIVDMPPSRLPGFTELLSAADWIVVPTKLERLSMEGVGLMAQAATTISREISFPPPFRGRQREGPRLLGVVPNMCRVRTKEHAAQMRELVATFGPRVWPPISMTIRVAEASSYGTTVFDLCPGDPVANQLNLVTDRLVDAIAAASPPNGGACPELTEGDRGGAK